MSPEEIQQLQDNLIEAEREIVRLRACADAGLTPHTIRIECLADSRSLIVTVPGVTAKSEQDCARLAARTLKELFGVITEIGKAL